MSRNPHESDLHDVVDMEAFSQILGMDDDGQEYSKGFVLELLEQLNDTLERINTALEGPDWEALQLYAKFLAGTSTTIGAVPIRDSSLRLSSYGMRQDLAGTPIDADDALERIKDVAKDLTFQRDEFKRKMNKFIG